MYKEGLFLRCNNINKIIDCNNVLSIIDNLYQNNKNASKEEVRSIVRENLVGKSFCATYGNFRCYKIEDVKFDENIHSFMVDE